MLLLITIALFRSLSWGLPNDAARQYGRTGVVKDKWAIKEVVLVNDVSVGLLHNDAHSMIAVSRSFDALTTLVNSKLFPNNLTDVTFHECNFKGQQSDRIGKDILVMYPVNYTWAVLIPQTGDLSEIWSNETARSILEGRQLEEGCATLLQKVAHLENSPGINMVTVVAVVLATIVFVTLILLSFVMFRNQVAHIGGVLGSIIHYPAHSFDVSLRDTNNQLELSDLPPGTRVND